MLTKVASAKEIRRTKDVLCTPIVLGESWRNFLAELLVNAPVFMCAKSRSGILSNYGSGNCIYFFRFAL